MKISSEKIDGKILYFQYLCKIVINPMRNIERTDTSRCRRALKAVLKAIWKAADIVLLTAGILSYVIIFVFPDIAVVRRKRRQVFSPAIRKCQQAKTAQ